MRAARGHWNLRGNVVAPCKGARAGKEGGRMPATYCSLHYHVIFSTKDRLPMLTSDWRGQMHAYLGGIVKSLNGVPLAAGGIDDHVHLLVGLRATHCLSDVLRELKSGSSEWAHATVGKKSFAWQAGYFGSTV